MTGSPEQEAAVLADYVARQLGARSARANEYRRLSGGAIQSNFALSLNLDGGAQPGDLALVVRSDSPSQVDVSLSRAQEFRILRAAFEAGVTVPEPLWLCEDVSLIGREFVIMRRAPGQGDGRTLVRQPRSAEQRAALVWRLGRELACLHQLRPPRPGLDFLPLPRPSPALFRVTQYRQALDALPHPQPGLEFALSWLHDRAPSDSQLALCHGDFRTGNLLVQDHELTAVLDWEFAAWSDPYEDLGWLCARSWRFGAHWPVGGIGDKTDLYDGYASVAGQRPDDARVQYWEVMAMARWAVIALQQAQRHLSGREQSLELALTGRMLPEIEFDLLSQIGQLGVSHG